MGQIVWLASYPKSGNTWLRVFLHNYILQTGTPHSVNALTTFFASEANAAFFSNRTIPDRHRHIRPKMCSGCVRLPIAT